jgi:spectinomycin phosphotransferase
LKYEPLRLSRAALQQVFEREFGLTAAALEFFPGGEDAAGYRIVSKSGERYFLRVQQADRAEELSDAFVLTTELRRHSELTEVVVPLPTLHGGYLAEMDAWRVAAFPYVQGTSADELGLARAQRQQLAHLLCMVHRCGREVFSSAPPGAQSRRERFENPFEAPIRHCLSLAESSSNPPSESAQALARLLIAEREDLLATLDRMRELGAAARRLPYEAVLTHGDPNLANVLIDSSGGLHLIDWGEVALGPPERDLSHFTGADFEAFLTGYLQPWGEAGLKLHRELFRFYAYRWVLQEIADYGSRILMELSSVEEVEHAWAELQPYLPIPHAGIAERISEVEATIRRVVPPLPE